MVRKFTRTAAVVAAAGSLLAAGVAPAHAASLPPQYEFLVFFHSGSYEGPVVGEIETGPCANTSWGTQTPYQSKSQYLCEPS